MSTLEVNTINPQSGSTITLGSSGNTVTLGSGVSGSGFGKIGQVIHGTTSTTFTTTSTSYVDSGFDIVITPSSTSSKIFVQFVVGTYMTGAGQGCQLAIYRNDSVSLTPNTLGGWERSETAGHYATIPVIALDSPNTTSAVTYTLYSMSRQGSGINAPNGGSQNSVIAMEVLA